MVPILILVMVVCLAASTFVAARGPANPVARQRLRLALSVVGFVAAAGAAWAAVANVQRVRADHDVDRRADSAAAPGRTR